MFAADHLSAERELLTKRIEFTGATRADGRLRAARWWVSVKEKGFRKISEEAFSVDDEPLPENAARWTVVISYEDESLNC
jgi:hypothetical protein